MARNIESFIYSFFTQTENIKPIAKMIHRQLASLKTLPLTDKRLIQLMEYVEQSVGQMLGEEKIIHAGLAKDQVECICSELGSLVKFHISYPQELYTDEWPALVDVRTEIQALARNIPYFIYSTFITPIKENNIGAATTAKISLGLQNLLASVLKAWVLQLTNCTTIPLTNDVLLQFMECIQRCLSQMSKDMSGPLRIQLELLHNEMGDLVHFHINYLPVDVRMEIQTMVMNTAYFVYSTLSSQTNQEEAKVIPGVHNLLSSILTSWVFTIHAKDYVGSTSDVVEKFAKLNVNVVDIIFLIILFRLQRITSLTDQLGFLNFFLYNVKELVHGAPHLEEFQTVREALLLLRDFLQSMTSHIITYSQDICERFEKTPLSIKTPTKLSYIIEKT